MRAVEQRDVVIIGGGAAGVSCALECVDIQLDAVVFEAGARPGGQLFEIPNSIRNVATGRFENGPVLADALGQSAALLGPRLRRSSSITRVDVAERSVEVDGALVQGRALVVATGTARQELPAAPDGAFNGAVTYSVGPEYVERMAGRPVVVVGGGDSGTLDALELAKKGAAVTLLHRSPALTARHDIVEQIRREPGVVDLAGWELDALQGSAELEAIVIRRSDGERQRVDARGLVVKIARAPRTQLFRGPV